MDDPVNILVVDDHDENLISMKGVLDSPQYHLLIARSGFEALDHLLRQEVALILMDVAMPVMDGFETASLIRGRERSKLVPIIFITASVYDMEHVFRGYSVGAVDYLRKPVDPHAVRGKVSVFVELFRQRKEIERQAALLREAEVQRRVADERARLVLELQDAVRARDEFLSVAAHELKTPLTPLRLQTSTLLRDRSGIDEKLAQRLAVIDRSAVRMDRLIDRLLDVSRLSAGPLRLELEDIDLGGVVRDVVARHDDEARHAGSSIEVIADEPVYGRWDRIRLDQVISNLLSNAIKYGAGKRIDIRVSLRGDVGQLEVRDFGIGIPADLRASIFERFERLVPLRNYSGFGLGLWIVRQIVDAHGGTIDVDGEVGEGSRFVIRLPVSRASTTTATTAAAHP